MKKTATHCATDNRIIIGKLISIITLIVLFTSTNFIAACELSSLVDDKQNSTSSSREYQIRQIGPRDYYRGHFKSASEQENIYFFIEVKPSEIVAGMDYYVVLLSKSGYLFSSAITNWSEFELIKPEEPDPEERDVRKLEEYKQRLSQWPPERYVVLDAPFFDKELEPLRNEFNSRNSQALSSLQAKDIMHSKYVKWRTDPVTEWKLGGMHLGETELQDICNKYIEVVITDREGFLKLATLK